MKRISTVVLLVLTGVLATLGHRALRRPSPDPLLGLWVEREARQPADPLHLYYFHKGGKGLYRYGQLGHNQTHSFDWRIVHDVGGDRLELLFRKTGERAATRFKLAEEGGQRTLRLESDPRSPTPTRYRFVPPNLDEASEGGPLALPAATASGGGGVDRMWIDLRKYATGGMGFTMYQLSRHPAEPGWSVGWHHVGDFDDWTTERLSYRLQGPTLRLHFTLRDEDATTPFLIDHEDPRARVPALTVVHDPRNFQAKSRFLDGGRSF